MLAPLTLFWTIVSGAPSERVRLLSACWQCLCCLCLELTKLPSAVASLANLCGQRFGRRLVLFCLMDVRLCLIPCRGARS